MEGKSLKLTPRYRVEEMAIETAMVQRQVLKMRKPIIIRESQSHLRPHHVEIGAYLVLLRCLTI
jgi:hypothetical protein